MINAIIMAAGTSSRFVPLSYEKPKGLLKVKGEVLIEREIRQLQEAGITDITVVVGYMKEKFFYLEDKFSVNIVVNEDYYKYNNPSSLMRVLDKLGNTYICSSDNYFVENVFESKVDHAYYAAVYADGTTEEYCLTTNEAGRIVDVSIGGCDSWYMLGHVYFDEAFSKQFREILISEYDEAKGHLWENLYMKHIDELDMYIRKYDGDKVLEFDSLDELRSFDAEYINNVDSRILQNICRILKCEVKDIVGIQMLKGGLTNTSFKFTVRGKDYVYRHPGIGTDKYINRRSEAESMKVASELGLDDTFIYMDGKEGWKISRYIEEARELDYHNENEVEQALGMVRSLHDARIESEYDFDIWAKTNQFNNMLKNAQGGAKTEFEDYETLYNLEEKVYRLITTDGESIKCLCHNDCYSPNFMLNNEDKMFLIDWEYSGNDDPASDLGTFICCSDYSYDEAVNILKKYLGKGCTEILLRHYIGYVAIAAYYWFVWALYQEMRGNPVGEWVYIWYRNSKLYGRKTLELFQA